MFPTWVLIYKSCSQNIGKNRLKRKKGAPNQGIRMKRVCFYFLFWNGRTQQKQPANLYVDVEDGEQNGYKPGSWKRNYYTQSKQQYEKEMLEMKGRIRAREKTVTKSKTKQHRPNRKKKWNEKLVNTSDVYFCRSWHEFVVESAQGFAESPSESRNFFSSPTKPFSFRSTAKLHFYLHRISFEHFLFDAGQRERGGGLRANHAI